MISKKIHNCEHCKHIYNITSHTCIRCTYSWESKLERPVVCPHCKSPSWDKERKKRKYADVVALPVGETIIVPWPHGIAFHGHPVEKLVNNLNAMGGNFKIDWKNSGAHVTRGPDRVKIEPKDL